MAVQWKPEHTRTSEYLFLPKDIKFKPELNGRHDLPDIEDLIADIVRHGQLQPVLLRSDGGTPILVGGFSRWRAVVEINKRKLTPEPMKLRCVYFNGTEREAVLANISENRFRNGTTPLDDAYNIARLERYGMTPEQIMAHYRPLDEFQVPLEEKKALKWLRDRLALVNLSEKSAEAMKDGIVKPSAATALAQLSEEQQAFAIREARKHNTIVTAASLKVPKPAKVTQKQDRLVDDSRTGEPEKLIDPQGNGNRASLMYKLVVRIASGGPIPFPWEYDVDARKFCKALLGEVPT